MQAYTALLAAADHKCRVAATPGEYTWTARFRVRQLRVVVLVFENNQPGQCHRMSVDMEHAQ